LFNQTDTFSFFAPAYLEKSSKTSAKGKDVTFTVGGVISTQDKDTDGEIVKGLDIDTYFTGGWGKIKYEHNLYKEPDCFIGYPKEVIKKGKDVHFVGELIAFDPEAKDENLTQQQRLAKSTVAFLRHIEDHNKQHPNNPQKAGWSIEGKILEKSKNVITKAQVINVVFTTKPVNTHTYAQLIKSLQVGYEHGGTNQTGFGATREESIGTKNNKRGNKMTKEQFYKSCLEKGMSREEALKETQKWESQNSEKFNSTSEEGGNQAGEAKEMFGKSIQILSNFRDKEYDPEIAATETLMQKSIEVGEQEDVDFAGYITGMKDLIVENIKGTAFANEKSDIIAKSLAVTNKAFEKVASANSALLEQNAYLKDEITSIKKSLELTNQLLSKSGGILTTNLINIPFAQENGGTEINKAKALDYLTDLAIEGGLSDTDVTKYENSDYLSEAAQKALQNLKN